jgi:hypothetical protein
LARAFDPATRWRPSSERRPIAACFNAGPHVNRLRNLRRREFNAIRGRLWLGRITHTLLPRIKQDLFAETPVATLSRRALDEKVGQIPARREQGA